MSVNEVFSQAIATAILAVMAAIGAKVNSALTTKRQAQKDIASAAEKINHLYAHLGLKPKTKMGTVDDLFIEIRQISAFLSFPAKPPIVDHYSPNVTYTENLEFDE